MHIKINYNNIQQHLEILAKQKKCSVSIKELLELSLQLDEVLSFNEKLAVEESIQSMQKLIQSNESRKQFLDYLEEESMRISKKVDDKLEEIESRLVVLSKEE